MSALQFSGAPWLTRSLKLLPVSQIDDLAERAQAGDRRALDELVLQTGRVTLKATRRAWSMSPELIDDISEGVLGDAMMSALASWERGKGCTFASWLKIRLRPLADRERLVLLGLPLSNKGSSRSAQAPQVFDLDAAVSKGTAGGSRPLTLAEVMPTDDPQADEVVERRRLCAWVRRAIERLPPAHRTVMRSQAAGGTLDDAGALLGGLTRERTRQIKDEAQAWLLALHEGEPLPRLSRSVADRSAERLAVMVANPQGLTAPGLARLIGEAPRTARNWLKANAEKRGALWFIAAAEQPITVQEAA